MFASITKCWIRDCSLRGLAGAELWSALGRPGASRALHEASEKPLAGVKVLDMSRIIAGPVCTQILADLGADVYKIENPGRGDDSRHWAPFADDVPWAGTTFLAFNRNKKSVCVNFRTVEGQQLLREMAGKCDILVENYVPGTLTKYGLDYDTIHVETPSLIYCSITGFGSDGPYSRKQGVDLVASSMAGILHLTGPRDGEPCRSATSSVDLMTGLYAHGAILAALWAQRRTGIGRHVECNLFQTAVTSLENFALAYLNANLRMSRMGTEHMSVVPYKAFPTSDGYVTVGAINDRQFVDFCSMLGMPELAQDERFVTAVLRSKNREELYRLLLPKFATKTTKEWCDTLAGTSLPHGPLNDLPQAFDDPHIKHMNLVKQVETADGSNKVKLLDYPVKLSDFKADISFPPTLGQHTSEVLRDVLQYTDERIDHLKSIGVVE